MTARRLSAALAAMVGASLLLCGCGLANVAGSLDGRKPSPMPSFTPSSFMAPPDQAVALANQFLAATYLKLPAAAQNVSVEVVDWPRFAPVSIIRFKTDRASLEVMTKDVVGTLSYDILQMHEIDLLGARDLPRDHQIGTILNQEGTRMTSVVMASPGSPADVLILTYRFPDEYCILVYFKGRRPDPDLPFPGLTRPKMIATLSALINPDRPKDSRSRQRH